jgi:hypothetical protein
MSIVPRHVDSDRLEVFDDRRYRDWDWTPGVRHPNVQYTVEVCRPNRLCISTFGQGDAAVERTVAALIAQQKLGRRLVGGPAHTTDVENPIVDAQVDVGRFHAGDFEPEYEFTLVVERLEDRLPGAI